MTAKDGDDMLVLILDRIIQRRFLVSAITSAIHIRAVGDQDFRGGSVGIGVSFAPGRTAHRDSIESSRSRNGILIDFRSVF